jgi:dihydrolipoamide dehydrogenase
MSHDLIVIGAGPGGYVCAIRAAQLGMRVALVEKGETLGGTCLNVGCIPSKALLHASHLYAEAGHGFAAMGIEAKPRLDLAQMMRFKDEGVKGNVDGVAFLMKKNRIEVLHGTARFAGPGAIDVAGTDGEVRRIEAAAIAIATGSAPTPLPGVDIDEKKILSSTGALALESVPKRLVVIGAGYIGLELGSVWQRLGAEVTVVEYLDRILPGMDGEVAKSFQRILERQGLKFRLGAKVASAETRGKGVRLTVEPAAGGDAETLDCEAALVAIGRRPNTQGLGLEEIGVRTDQKGRIVTTPDFRTSVEGVYAIGDVIAGPMLAHKAEDEGVALAEYLAGQAGHVNYDAIPGVVYTHPEVASVGLTEEQLKETGRAYRAAKFPLTANGRAKVNRTTDGFVKVLADAETDRLLGVHIVAAEAGTMIAEAVALIEFGASAEDLARISHAHPTLSEAMKEAALAIDGRALHM